MHRPPAKRLSAMFALEFTALGAIAPLLSVYLTQDLGLSGSEAGMVMACSAISAFIAPVYGSIIADRRMPARFLLALCHFFTAVLILVFAGTQTFIWVFLSYLGYQAAFAPTIGLTNSIAFQQLADKRSAFGGIRVWGTIAWVAVAWLGGWWLSNEQHTIHDMLYFSAAASLILIPIACALPKPPTAVQPKRHLIPHEALAACRKPLVWKNGLCYAMIAATYQFHFLGTGPF